MPPHLFAYLDLASGSMIIQAVIAGLVAAPILLRHQIRRLFGREGAANEVAPEQGVAMTATADARLDSGADGSEPSRP